MHPLPSAATACASALTTASRSSCLFVVAEAHARRDRSRLPTHRSTGMAREHCCARSMEACVVCCWQTGRGRARP